MATVDVLVMAVALLSFALVSRRLERWWITMPMVFVSAGALFEATDVVDLSVAVDQVAVLAEITLAVILFSDAVRMNGGELRANAALPIRLLLIGLPLTIAFGTVVTWALLPGIGLAAAALVASVLAPTDAALGEAIVSEPSVPERIRDALNVEAGLNDGLAVPAVLLFIDLTEGELESSTEWARFLVRQIGGGTFVGALVGAASAWLVGRTIARGWTEGLYTQLATLAVAVATFTLAEELAVNAFIAAFVAGLAFGSVLADEQARRLDEYTEDSGALLATVAFFVFGNLFVVPAFETLTWQVVVCAVATLTVGRMLPVTVATAGMGFRPPTIAFLGWFGPRGLASIVFGVLLLEADLDVGDELFDVIALVVLFSVFAHGISATPGAAAYGRWYTRTEGTTEPMMESEPGAPRRLRRRAADLHRRHPSRHRR